MVNIIVVKDRKEVRLGEGEMLLKKTMKVK